MSNCRIYFISSYEEKNPKQEFYTETPGFNDVKSECIKQIKCGAETFVVLIYSFNIIKKDLTKNKETDTYDLTVNLKVPSIILQSIYSKTFYHLLKLKITLSMDLN